MHPIDEHSPLHNATQSALGESDVAIVVILTGIDETVSQTVHARHIYSAQDILCNMAFVDLFFNLPDGRRAIDYRHFHDVRPL
jgi:inward rectifier potassium channel